MTEERSESAAGLSFKMGEALLRNGAEIFRVQETMERVARAYDIEEYDVYVLSNAIFANAVENGEKIDTKLKFVPGSTIHFGRIVGINQLSREIVAGKVSVEEAYARLHEIVSIPYTHPIRLDLACAVGSACFSYLFGGTVFDAAAAFICGFVLQVFLNAIDSRTASKFIINLASSAVVAVCAVLLFTVGLGDSLDKIIIGSIIRLVPGVALTTSIRDFLNGDYLSGTIRIIDALAYLYRLCIFYGRCCVRVVFCGARPHLFGACILVCAQSAAARVPHRRNFSRCARRRYLLYGLSHFHEQQRRGDVQGRRDH